MAEPRLGAADRRRRRSRVLRWRVVEWRRARAARTHAHHGHDHDHGHDARPRPRPRSTATTRSLSMRGLLGVGISGGIIPCPTALVVLLAAISLHRVGYGLVLIVAFSLGLAATVSGIGLLAVGAKGVFGRARASSAASSALLPGRERARRPRPRPRDDAARPAEGHLTGRHCPHGPRTFAAFGPHPTRSRAGPRPPPSTADDTGEPVTGLCQLLQHEPCQSTSGRSGGDQCDAGQRQHDAERAGRPRRAPSARSRRARPSRPGRATRAPTSR